jgi:hypothetical protein
MAQVIDTVERDGRVIRVYDNGMERDASTGRIVKPASGTLITAENATEYHRMRRNQKQAVIAAAANAAVERADFKAHGGMAFVAAIADTAMLKATTPDDPKAIDAARFLLQESGLAEPKGVQEQVSAVTPLAQALGTVIAMLRDMQPEVITVTPEDAVEDGGVAE